MESAEQPLKEGEAGPYGTLAGRPLPDGLALLFMPSLAALLAQAEQLKDKETAADVRARMLYDAAWGYREVGESEIAAKSDAAIGNLIFTPGFSTASTITSISGRGVGMDVVRANI